MDAPGPFQARLTKIDAGMPGIHFEIGRMMDLVREGCVDPDVIETARSLTLGCRPRDRVCEIEKIYDFVRQHFRFVDDPTNNEAISTVERFLREIREKGRTSGDCDEVSTFLATLLSAVGIPARFRFGGRGRELSHVWVQAQLFNGRWVDLEPSGYLDPGFYFDFPSFTEMEIFPA